MEIHSNDRSTPDLLAVLNHYRGSKKPISWSI